MNKSGNELKVGDSIAVMWRPGRDTITALRPYTGPLAPLFSAGASLASFGINASGMTIDHDQTFEVMA